MLSPISNNSVSSMQPEAAALAKPTVSSAPQQASLQPDTVSISSQGHTAAAVDVDHDGDSH
jgi:hypothetical protein